MHDTCIYQLIYQSSSSLSRSRETFLVAFFCAGAAAASVVEAAADENDGARTEAEVAPCPAGSASAPSAPGTEEASPLLTITSLPAISAAAGCPAANWLLLTMCCCGAGMPQPWKNSFSPGGPPSKATREHGAAFE